MIFTEKPVDFNPKFEVVSCFVRWNSKILLLHRQDTQSHGDTWGVPAGKKKEHENINEAMVRELQEEAGFEMPSSSLHYFGKVYVRFTAYDLVYYMFSMTLDNPTGVMLNPHEHKDFRWVAPEQAFHMPLIHDLGACIRLFYKR